MSIGSTIKFVRKQRSLNQKALADSLEISQSYLSQIENDRREPSPRLLKGISHKLDVPFPVLLLLALDEKDVSTPRRQEFDTVMAELRPIFLDLFLENDETPQE